MSWTGCTTLFAAASGNLVIECAGLSGGLGASFLSDAGIVVAGVWACTVERPNKWPVTDNWIDLGAVQDCRSSYQGGKHSTSNFRSDHSAGLYFLFADGSVRWIATSIDLTEYRARHDRGGRDRRWQRTVNGLPPTDFGESSIVYLVVHENSV